MALSLFTAAQLFGNFEACRFFPCARPDYGMVVFSEAFLPEIEPFRVFSPAGQVLSFLPQEALKRYALPKILRGHRHSRAPYESRKISLFLPIMPVIAQ